MRLLIDSDSFCKLSIAGFLDETAGLFGTDLSHCGRLHALPHMLRRGRLRTTLGAPACDQIIPLTAQVPAIGSPGEEWLDRLVAIPDVDPGEAQLFALAAESGLVVVSGDKRALRAIKNIDGFAVALSNRTVVLEAILLALCNTLGVDEVRRRTLPLIGVDKVVRICFSSGNVNPIDALDSYYRDLAAELSPLILWNPTIGGSK